MNHFDTSRVESMLSMFGDCEELKELDLSHFDTSQVRDMKYMFADCSNLERLDISNFEVKQIWTWDMVECFRNVTVWKNWISAVLTKEKMMVLF